MIFPGMRQDNGPFSIIEYASTEERGSVSDAIEKFSNTKLVCMKGFYSIPDEKDIVFAAHFMDDEDPFVLGELKSGAVFKENRTIIRQGDRYICNSNETARYFMDKSGSQGISTYEQVFVEKEFTAEGKLYIKTKNYDSRKLSIFMDKETMKMHIFAANSSYDPASGVSDIKVTEIELDENTLKIIKRDTGGNEVGSFEMLADGTINLN